ncbi:MAG: PIN domain-containing protein, partial [Bryobacteraceae bacterium]
MDAILDTNVLIAAGQAESSQADEIENAITTLTARAVRICVFSQNLFEFWNVCTRPADVNGLGLQAAESLARLSDVESLFHRLPDSDAVYATWRNLIAVHEVRGTQVHDARIVAAMRV